MEGIVEQPACASVAAPPNQLNDPPPSEPHRQRRPSGSHAGDGTIHTAGQSHRACAVARTEDADKGKGDRKDTGRGPRTGNRGGHAPAPSSHHRPPPRPGSHLKPRRSWGPPATTPHRVAPASLYQATAPQLLVSGLPPPLPSNPFFPGSSSQNIVHQEAFKFNPYPYILPFPVLQPPIPTIPNYFHGNRPPLISNTSNVHYYHLVSTVMSSTPTSPSSPNGPAQPDTISWQEKLKRTCTEKGLPEPKMDLVSDRRGGRTAWSSIVTIGTVKIPARCWYSGHFNAFEDACEVFLKELHKLEQWNEPRTSLSRAATFPAYRTPSNAGGPNGFYGSIGEVAAPPQFSGSLGPHVHPELMSRGSQQPHSASFVSHYSS